VTEDLNSLLAGFTESAAGITHAAIVTSVGLPLASSEGFPPDLVDQLAAVTSGLTSMVSGAARMLGGGPVLRTIVAMERGVLIVTPINGSLAFSALAAADCDLGLASSEMAVLGEQALSILSRVSVRRPPWPRLAG
jgi:hypothetical protein